MMKNGEPCTLRGVSTVLEGVTPRPLTKESMAWCFLPYEIYTMMRYLEMNELRKRNIATFDNWASTFGEIVTALELSPEGKGYRLKNRFAKFYNIPELMSLFKQIADIQTAEQLKLPIPELETGKPISVQMKSSQYLKDYIESLSKRADKIRQGVDPRIDNMLNVTNDGRKAALDIRLIDPDLPDLPDSKVNIATKNMFNIWEKTKKEKLTQIMFCDLSTPNGKNSDKFNVYDDIKNKLIEMGVPENEIAFIHYGATRSCI